MATILRRKTVNFDQQPTIFKMPKNSNEITLMSISKSVELRKEEKLMDVTTDDGGSKKKKERRRSHQDHHRNSRKKKSIDAKFFALGGATSRFVYDNNMMDLYRNNEPQNEYNGYIHPDLFLN
uniref:Uncharacterized protein n=1 Tax=Euplotes crassus TaxID=5936 RepID=A0A7S3KS19_EUPCR|mmetsp:Transcript_38852/g.38418  ORF Transcript_38852/g.38418 Transcript_38852/m.38418 type:complete len:123 (+) Transcript_38852:534-902(+)|eukprot:CAMPEP_0197012790 /NCGR_PEP_ID=MMETSP1380-20130617/63738_1 /TAXON_ID=5936 /ORGANISM="Euplotes crassus, Strain CT5" /LENGTH=122 /DNA_ID=CAMNT_0042436545 /DNA_START=521 /DNA_END=889 /DNA_ORIENTATION=+